MSPSEIAFLALGLVVGTAVGAALVQLVRHGPTPRREVRLTITPNAIPPRRAHTLAVPYGVAYPGLIPGSPEDGAFVHGPARSSTGGTPLPPAGPAVAPPDRTRVPSAPVATPVGAVAVSVGGAPVMDRGGARAIPTSAMRLASEASVGASTGSVAVLDAPPRSAAKPWQVLTGRDDPFATLDRPGARGADPRPVLVAETVAIVARPMAAQPPVPLATADPADGPAPVAATGRPDTATDPCAGARRMVDERCALAEVALAQAREAADALREAQRTYDVLRDRVDRAQAQADPRRVAAAKEQLHAAFRAASDRAGTPEETEAAARAWLGEINQLNAAVREALRVVDSGGAGLRAQLPVLERLAALADSARISGENAEVGCRDAREELAGCDEALARARAAVPSEPEEPHPFEGIWPVDQPDLPSPSGPLSPAERLTGLPVIVRILGGDRAARERLVAALAAGEPPGAEHEWQLRLARLVDAIVARAIEDGYLDLPDDDPFWRQFGQRESRDIVGALSALGFRYDGLGGFADGRVPGPRDLSLAVGYAGQDRMRIRSWPRESELAGLYARAVVAADEWLADQAGDLSLGRMVDALGGRATELADVWNAWGRIRPALLAP